MMNENPVLEEIRAMYRREREAFMSEALTVLDRTTEFARSLEKAIGEVSRDQALDGLVRRFVEEVQRVRDER